MMIRFIVVAVVLVTACGKGKGKEPAAGSGTATTASGSGSATGSGSSAAVAAKDAPPCPKDDALKEKVAELLKVKKESIDFAECVVGHWPEGAWVLAVRHSKEAGSADEGSNTFDRTLVVDSTGKILADQSDEVPFGAIDSSGSGDYQAADLDGDGTDELIYIFSSDKRGYMMKVLIVQRFAKGEWQEMLSKQFDYDDSAAEPEEGVTTCEAKWTLDPAGADKKRTITFEPLSKPKKQSGDACIMAKETWAIGADGKYAKK